MKNRTFTVLIRDDYEFAPEMTDEQAVTELRDCLQAACDDGHIGGNFLIVNVEDGDEAFWAAWKKGAGETAEDIAKRYIPGLARQVGVTTGWFS